MDIPAPTPLAARPTVALGCIGGALSAQHFAEAVESGFAPVIMHRILGEMIGADEGPREMLAATRLALGKNACAIPWGAGAVVTTTEEAAALATAGFTWFTFDLADATDDRAAAMSLDQLDAAIVSLEDAAIYRQGWHERYVDQEWRTESGRILTIADEALARAAVKFGPALAHADQLQQAIRTLWVGRGQPPDIELNFSGTRTATSHEEFLFLTLESTRRGLNPASIAPSLGFDWQPGAGFFDEPRELEAHLATLGQITTLAGPLKIGIHHTAGKIDIVPLARRILGDRCHVNCEEAAWLEILGRMADSEPRVFREWLDQARESFPFAAAGLALGITEDDIHALPEVSDAALRDTFLGHVQGRQLLLSTFLHVLRQQRSLRDAMRRMAGKLTET